MRLRRRLLAGLVVAAAHLGVELHEFGASLEAIVDAGGIEEGADWIGFEVGRGAHPFARFFPIGVGVALELNEVVFRILVVDRYGHAVVEAGDIEGTDVAEEV